MDVGQSKDLITGTTLYLRSLREKNLSLLYNGSGVVGNALVVGVSRSGQNSIQNKFSVSTVRSGPFTLLLVL